jgi:hypothetical protein
MDVKTRKKLSVEQAFSHALLQVIATSQLISHNKSVTPIQTLMIPELFKDTISSLRSVYTSIMLDSVQFLRSTYDYLETWLYTHSHYS